MRARPPHNKEASRLASLNIRNLAPRLIDQHYAPLCRRIAKLQCSPVMPEGECTFSIGEGGITAAKD